MYKKIILVLAVLFMIGCTTSADHVDVMEDEMDDGMMDDSDAMMDDSMMEDLEETITFTLTGHNFAFEMEGEENPTLTVQEGDVVRIEFSSTSGFHDVVIDEFSAATKQVRPEDGMTYVEFVADASGTYEYYCSVGSHRAQGMVGTLIVE